MIIQRKDTDYSALALRTNELQRPPLEN